MIYAEIDPEDPKKILISEHQRRLRPVIESIPSAHYKDDMYRLSLTWPTALAMSSDLKKFGLTIGPNLKEWMSDHYLKRILPAFNIRDVVDEPEGYEMLYPHQRGDVKFLFTAERALLANDMGTGKTLSTLATIKHISETLGNEAAYPVLVACPNSTKWGWKKEAEAFLPEGTRITVIDGTATKRRKIFEEEWDVIIINWESIRSHSRLKAFGNNALKKCEQCGGLDPAVKPAACEAHDKELNHINFQTVVGDEIHRIADPAAKGTRAFKRATGDARFRIGLSGTPLRSAPDDLFSPLNWLDPEAYPSKGKFISRFCDVVDSFYGSMVVGIKDSMQQEFFSGLDPILRRMPKDVILKFLPPILRSRRDVEMSTKQKKAYTQMRDQMIAELDDDEVVYTTQPLVKLSRMLQFASAFGAIEYKDVVDKETGLLVEKPFLRLTDPSCKVDAFMEDLPDFGEDSVIVFAQSKQLINLLAARFTKNNIPFGLITGDQDSVERQAYMDAFQAGKIRYIFCTIQAGGTGITLTRARTMVFLQRSYSMVDNLQAEARAHRIGSEMHDSVEIIDYVTKNTIEEAVFEAIERKADNLEFILRDKDLILRALDGDIIDVPESNTTLGQRNETHDEFDEEDD